MQKLFREMRHGVTPNPAAKISDFRRQSLKKQNVAVSDHAKTVPGMCQKVTPNPAWETLSADGETLEIPPVKEADTHSPHLPKGIPNC